MKQRCNNPKASRYESYGGRGIKVCAAWEKDFLSFYSDMADGYSKGLQLGRIDTNGDYCKENCRWVKPAENVKNRTNTIFYKGVCLKDYCKQNNLCYNTVVGRIRQYNWPIEEAVKQGNFRGERGHSNA